MSPNLFLLARKACSPHRWLESKAPSRPLDFTEIWSRPVPGIYRHKPGSGWSLVAIKDSSEFFDLEEPVKVVYAKPLHRYIFQEDFLDRKCRGMRQDSPRQNEPQPFFRMDDGITWIQCYDANEKFIPGPYQRFVFDERTHQFRPMLKKDNMDGHTTRSASDFNSEISSLHLSSGDNSAELSRRNSSIYNCGSTRLTPAVNPQRSAKKCN